MDTTCQDGNTPCLLILTPLRDRNSIFLNCQTGKSRWTSRLGQTNVSCRTQLQCDSLVLSWLSAAMGTPPYSALESVGLSSIASIIVWDGNHWPLSGLRVSFFFFFYRIQPWIIIFFLLPLKFCLNFCFFGVLWSKRKRIIHQGTFDRYK